MTSSTIMTRNPAGPFLVVADNWLLEKSAAFLMRFLEVVRSLGSVGVMTMGHRRNEGGEGELRGGGESWVGDRDCGCDGASGGHGMCSGSTHSSTSRSQKL